MPEDCTSMKQIYFFVVSKNIFSYVEFFFFSSSKVFYKIGAVKILQKLQKNVCAGVFLLITSNMEPSDFIETETAVQIFSVNFAKHRLRRTSANGCF